MSKFSCSAQFLLVCIHPHPFPMCIIPHPTSPPHRAASPRNVDYQQVLNDLQAVKGVKRAHGLHIWSLTMDKVALSVHLVIGMHWRGVDPYMCMFPRVTDATVRVVLCCS